MTVDLFVTFWYYEGYLTLSFLAVLFLVIFWWSVLTCLTPENKLKYTINNLINAFFLCSLHVVTLRFNTCLVNCVDILSENYVRKSESFNSVSESQKCDTDVVRPKTLSAVDRKDGDGEASGLPDNGSVPVNQYLCFIFGQTSQAYHLMLSIFILNYLSNLPPNLHLASSEQWCWSGGRGILTELSLCYSLVLCSILAMLIAQS